MSASLLGVSVERWERLMRGSVREGPAARREVQAAVRPRRKSGAVISVVNVKP
jgi:hypothetical protein